MDEALLRRINDWTVSTGWLHGPAIAYAKYGVVVFAGLLALAFWNARQRGDRHGQAAAIWAGASVFVALGFGMAIGWLVDRPRPYTSLHGVHVLIARNADWSFPSDHATAVAAVAAGLWLLDRRLGIVATVLALLMAFTRVYVGVHYPSDVVAGLVLGATVALAGAASATRLIERLLARGTARASLKV